MRASELVQVVSPKTKTSKEPTPTKQTNSKRNITMKKILIALAAVTALGAGASAAQARVNVDLYLGGFGGYGHNPHYTSYYDEPDCHYVRVKKVFWVDGYRVVKYKKKLVCNY
jgi:hypothetical protein